MKSLLTHGLCLFGLLAPLCRGDYAIVVHQPTLDIPAWRAVVDALQQKYPQARVLPWETSVEEVLPDLQRLLPRHTCFVAQPETAGRDFVGRVHQLTRRLDEDPYPDTFWGILTGYDAANALAIARTDAPLTIQRVASGTELAMDKVSEGRWYCELRPGHRVRKNPGEEARTLTGEQDTTEVLVDCLNDYHAQLFVTSGHATERDWQIGFRYPNGTFRCREGRLYGRDLQGQEFPVDASDPTVYLPIGNCLMGHINDRDAMALAWMNSAGVRQMMGYTVPTWYGYAGWGLLDYFVEQPGRYTLTEAFFANQVALIHRLETAFPGLNSQVDWPQSTRFRGRELPFDPTSAKRMKVQPSDARGLLFDRDVVAFYGDPAWEARMAEGPKHYSQELVEDNGVWTLTVTAQRGTDSFSPVHTNGAQRGHRPIVAWLPKRIGPANILAGKEWYPTVGDNFVLVPNPHARGATPAEIVVQFEVAD